MPEGRAWLARQTSTVVVDELALDRTVWDTIHGSLKTLLAVVKEELHRLKTNKHSALENCWRRPYSSLPAL
jgi:hypothetical protein